MDSSAIKPCADLQGAKLQGAKLQGANLQGACGIERLPVGDPRGYDPVAVIHPGGWMISAGCRWLTHNEAVEHWGDGYACDRRIADRYLYALKWLKESQEEDNG